MTHDFTYLDLVNRVLTEGKPKKNRTGIDTIGIFGAQARFDLADGFPLLTTKKVFFKGIVHELLWFISGSTNIKYLVDNGVHIWDDWAYQRYLKFISKFVVVGESDKPTLSQADFIHRIKTVDEFAKIWGDLGMGTYGGMWRAFPFYNDYETVASAEGRETLDTVDQLKKVIEKLKTNPDDRRLIVSAWHPHWVDHCALPPCHCLFHFHTEELAWHERLEIAQKKDSKNENMYYGYSDEDFDRAGIPKRRLNCLLYQRSCDLFLGVPFNIASYALLTQMLAQQCELDLGDFVWTGGDCHIYSNHFEQVQTQLARQPLPYPQLQIKRRPPTLFDYELEDFELTGYLPHPAIKAPVAV